MGNCAEKRKHFNEWKNETLNCYKIKKEEAKIKFEEIKEDAREKMEEAKFKYRKSKHEKEMSSPRKNKQLKDEDNAFQMVCVKFEK